MSANRILPGVLLVVLISMASTVQITTAQDGSNVLSNAREDYRNLDYDAARVLLNNLIERPGSVRPDDLARAHVYLGLIEFNTDAPLSARDHFFSALTLNPDTVLDPLDASPKAINFFATIRNDFDTIKTTQSVAAIQYIVVEDPRMGAAMRSMILPGWGQTYKGETRKGYLMAGAWATAGSLTVVAHVVRMDRRRSYLDEMDPERVSDRFDTYSRWHKIRNSMALTAAGVWLASYLDAFLVRPRTPNSQLALSVRPGITADKPNLAVTLRF